MVDMTMRPNTLESIMDRLDRSDDCWLWTGVINSNGYGVVRYQAKPWKVHRLVYTLLVSDPGALPLDHTCRVRHCANPAHLEPVTVKENVQRSLPYRPLLHSKKTHCSKGHEFTPDNTGTNSVRRWCKTCKRDFARSRRAV